MLREMQREVNTGHPFESKLHIDYSTNNHPTQLHAANDIDCCFMAILSWRKTAGPRIMRKLQSNLKPNHSLNFREQKADLRELIETKRTPQISWWHLKIMTFANPGVCWNSKTVISGYNQEFCPGTSLSS